jgi:hypothetical protein
VEFGRLRGSLDKISYLTNSAVRYNNIKASLHAYSSLVSHTKLGKDDKGFARRQSHLTIIWQWVWDIAVKEYKMTKDANLKKIVRDRMSHSQQNYTSAKQTITERPLYTITIVSFSPDKEKGEIASRFLTGAISDLTHAKYGLREYVDPIVGWTSIRPGDSLVEYFTQDGGTVPRSRYTAAGRKILVEYLHEVSMQDLVNLVLPNTDIVILHDTLNYNIALEETGLSIARALSKLPEAEQELLNTQMQIISEWWEGGLVDIVTSHAPRLVIYIPREADYMNKTQIEELEQILDNDDRTSKKLRLLSESEELSTIYKKGAAILLENWLK